MASFIVLEEGVKGTIVAVFAVGDLQDMMVYQ